MYFQDDDLFLVNRNNVSSVMKAKSMKDFINPEGNVEEPTIEYPVENQGFPVSSAPIVERTGAVTGDSNLILTLEDTRNLNLLDGNMPQSISTTNKYTPITTSINKVQPNGNEYTIYFNSINFDFGLFEVGDNVRSSGGLSGQIKTIITTSQSFIIESTEFWGASLGQTVEGTAEFEGTGQIDSYTIDADGNPSCVISSATGYWIDENNNRNQQMTFDTQYPVGGAKVDKVGSIFIASPFVSDNPALTLQEVTWTLNGVQYNQTVTDPYGKQMWEVPNGVITESVNTLYVRYKAGNNFSPTNNRRYFIGSDTSFRMNTMKEMYDAVELYQGQATTLGL